MRPRFGLLIIVLLLITAGCSGSAEDDADTGVTDVGGAIDSGDSTADVGGDEEDIGPADTGTTDTGTTDTDTPDTGTSDTGSPDTGTGGGASCGGFAGDAFCEADEFCVYERGDTGESTCLSNGIGTCTTQPTSCDDEFDPVCGCDSQTYDNKCQAHLAGVDVYVDGPCTL